MLHPCPGPILFELTPYLESSFFLHNLVNLQIFSQHSVKKLSTK